jgi:hypothetical protein
MKKIPRALRWVKDELVEGGVTYHYSGGIQRQHNDMTGIGHCGISGVAGRPRPNMSGIGDLLANNPHIPIRYVKCPFCGTRHDVKEHGAMCSKCNGDVMEESVV